MRHSHALVLALAPALVALAGCPLTATRSFDLTPVGGMPGPEDLVLDRGERLLVSSQTRRPLDAQASWPDGAIFALDPATLAVVELPRTGEPEGMPFRPHGIDLVQRDDGERWLYAVVHAAPGTEPEHAIVVYRVHDDRLEFLQRLTDPTLTSPNDLTALPDGTIYVSNDHSADGGNAEMIFALKRSAIAYYDGAGWRVVADRIAYGNGITVVGNRVLQAATRENAIYAYQRLGDGSLTHRERLARVPGPDNLFVTGQHLFVACHERPLAFVRHARREGRRSPSTVWRIDLGTGEAERLFADDGSQISGSATGVWFDGALYIGQVFDPFVVVARPTSP